MSKFLSVFSTLSEVSSGKVCFVCWLFGFVEHLGLAEWRSRGAGSFWVALVPPDWWDRGDDIGFCNRKYRKAGNWYCAIVVVLLI